MKARIFPQTLSRLKKLRQLRLGRSRITAAGKKRLAERLPRLIYQGTWLTTNRQLDGTMTCVVSDLGDNKWRDHFDGVWQGVAFSYKVDFSGPPDKLRGTARIAGADYTWTGQTGKGRHRWFKGAFGGNRYEGNFALKPQVNGEDSSS